MSRIGARSAFLRTKVADGTEPLFRGFVSLRRVAAFAIALLALFALTLAAAPHGDGGWASNPRNAGAISAEQQQRAKSNPARDSDALVRDIVANELLAEQNDQSYWRYLETVQERGKTTVREVVETKQCDVHRVLTVNGQPLGDAQAAREKARVTQLLNDRDALSKKHANQMRDVERERKLLKMLADAFRYTSAGQDGKLLKLNFTPNPSFHPSGHQGVVFHQMAGAIWVDPQQKRIARIQGTLTSDVHFGGFLGRLRKGGTFDVEQQEVGDGYWELTRLDVHMRGRMLLFKGIDVDQSHHDTSFARVPAGLTPNQVAELLENAVAPSQGAAKQNQFGR